MNSDEIIFLLGAGASYEAKIPISSQMINELENLFKENEWEKYKNLYYCLKSGIQYGFGIINKNEDMNIEVLVNTMDELIKSYAHPIYPFVGSWVPRLDELAGEGFKNIKHLKALIIKQLEKWMDTSRLDSFDYYHGLIKFQQELQFPLSIFSLNYDLCLEKQCKKHDIECNRGFKDYIWEYKNFDKHDDSSSSINLYKLHGSIDWENNDNTIEEKDGIIDKHAIIFGTSYKLQYLDPFLFLIYRFRQQTLESATKIINCIGYSFSDEHINGILRQALIRDNSKKIISIRPLVNNENREELRILKERRWIKEKLNLESIDNIIVVNNSAKNFLENDISKDFYMQCLRDNEEPF